MRKVYIDGFCERLNECILTSGKTKKEIDNECGFRVDRLWKYTHGGTMPSAYILLKLCVTLDISADYLLGLSPAKNLNETIRKIYDSVYNEGYEKGKSECGNCIDDMK